MRVLARVLGYLRPYAGRLVAATVMLVIAGALMGGVVSTVKPLVNEVLLGKPASPTTSDTRGLDILRSFRDWVPTEQIAGWAREHAFVEVPLLIVLIYVIRGVFSYFGEYYTVKAGACMIRDLRMKLFESVAFQSLSFFQTHPTGLILSRIVHDVTHLQRVATTSMAAGVRVAAMVPFLLIVALWHEWRMSLLFVISGLAVSFVWRRYTPGRLAVRRIWRLLLPLIFGMAFIVAPHHARDFMGLLRRALGRGQQQPST